MAYSKLGADPMLYNSYAKMEELFQTAFYMTETYLKLLFCLIVTIHIQQSPAVIMDLMVEFHSEFSVKLGFRTNM